MLCVMRVLDELDRMTCKLYYEYCNPLTSIVQTLNQISLQSLVKILSFVILVCTYFQLHATHATLRPHSCIRQVAHDM
jgi:hypothetical protein